jgi:hypothetical protein
MIDPSRLLPDLQRLLKRLEDDIRFRTQEDESINGRLRKQYDTAKAASRTAQAYEVWRDEYITQVAVAWILGCVFVRFLEDNGLIATAWLSGPGTRLQLARDQHTVYFQRNPSHSDRDYLEHVFAEIAKLPSMLELLGGEHNALTKLGPSGDGAHDLLESWQRIDPATGALVHDFTDPEWDTRFLGDLYQDLSESARERYALLQTPEFVEKFILDRTLDPAIEEFGYATIKVIDPACGSGHFLLGCFRRLIGLRLRYEPGTPVRARAQAVLDQVYGVDLNPYAIAIARFRLLIAAIQVCGVANLVEAPGFRIGIAAGDSLLHGPSPLGLVGVQRSLGQDTLQHHYDTEDADRVNQFLTAKYHVVVGNPPYVTVKDRSLSRVYRTRFRSCHRQYSLAVPFLEQCFHLGLRQELGGNTPAAYIGVITANSFIKREFGKKLIEEYVPRWDLTYVIDTSKAYIPGHATPTVILLARNRVPVSATVRTVMGIRAEERRPENPSLGLAWRAILSQIDHPGSTSPYISVSDLARQAFAKHPWSIGGGGAADLYQDLNLSHSLSLEKVTADIGIASWAGIDEIFVASESCVRRWHWPNEILKPFIPGDVVRNWSATPSEMASCPHRGSELLSIELFPTWHKSLWRFRTDLRQRVLVSGKTFDEEGLPWWSWVRWIPRRYRDDAIRVVFPFVATHNHFVRYRGDGVFNRHAPVITLAEANDNQVLGLVAVLNSSMTCFWMRQTFHNKGGGGIGGGLATEEWEQRFEFDGTKLKRLPIPHQLPGLLAQKLDALSSERMEWNLPTLISQKAPGRELFLTAREKQSGLLNELISLQEELDWECYRLYGILEDDLTLSDSAPPPIHLGERAFEIVLARKMAEGELETTWFQRHGSTPITEIPAQWPEMYRRLVERRISAIQSNGNIALIEQPEYKRRWNLEPSEDQEVRALRNWLCGRMEDSRYWCTLELTSCARLADCLQADAEFRGAAELYRGRPDFDWIALVIELVEAESVPFLAVLRHTESGQVKHEVWERTWGLQRQEDRINAELAADTSIPESLKAEVAKKRRAEQIGDIPPPPKYESKDFRKPSYWGLRGKLDVPKERFVSFPHCERDVDPTPVIAWAGWDDLQTVRAIAAYYERVKNQEGWTAERRIPLLAGILELLPWLKQWHNEIHQEFQERMGEFFEQFVQDEARAMEVTIPQISAWAPPASTTRGRRRRNS